MGTTPRHSLSLITVRCSEDRLGFAARGALPHRNSERLSTKVKLTTARVIAACSATVMALAPAVSMTSANAAPATYRFDPAHPCKGLTMTTHITARMIPKVVHCKSIQAPVSTIPHHSVVYHSPTRLSRYSTYKLCLASSFGIPWSNGLLCRKQTSKGSWAWLLAGVEGQPAIKYNNNVAEKIDDTIIEQSTRHNNKSNSMKILKACSAGAIGGVIAGIGSGPGMLLGATGGCVGGSLTVVFTDK